MKKKTSKPCSGVGGYRVQLLRTLLHQKLQNLEPWDVFLYTVFSLVFRTQKILIMLYNFIVSLKGIQYSIPLGII